MRKLNLILILLFLATSIGLSVAYYPKLPDQVASHFGSSGEPNDWISKEGITILFPVFMLIPLLVLAPMIFLMRRIPLSLVNLPHKDYWMAPERREKTFASIQRFFLIFSTGLCLLFLVLQIATFQFALGELDNVNTVILPAVFGYLGITAVMVLWLFIHFGRIHKEGTASADDNPYSQI